MFRKLKLKMLFALVAFIFGSYYANAANVYTYTHSATGSKTITLTTSESTKFYVDGDTSIKYDQLGRIEVTGGGTLIIVFNTSNFVRQSDQMRVEKGKLFLKLGNDYNSSVTIKRAKSYNGYLFYSKNSTSSSSNCILQIQGKSGKKFHIHGNGNLKVTGSNETGWTASNDMAADNVDAQRAVFGLGGGQADLDYVIVSDNYNSEHEGHSYHSGAFHISITDDSKSLEKVTMDNCEILRCFTNNSGSAMYYLDIRKNPTTVSSVTMTNTIIDGCFCNGLGHSNDFGTIRTVGYSCGTLKMTNCTIQNNKTMRNGGGLSWNACMTDYSLQMIGCTVKNNWASTSGGGLSLDGSVIIKKCSITDNWAQNSGGGIYYTSYSNTADNDIFEDDFKPCNLTLSLDAETVISRNHAGQQGGGIRYQIAPVSFHNEELVQAGTAWTVFSNNEGKQLEISLKIDGTTIEDNEAVNGAGICITRTTFIYKSDLEIDAGNINNNTASNHGGGIYVNSDNTGTVYHPLYFPWTNTVMNVTFGEEGTANQLLVQNNQAKDGGAAYIKGEQHVTKIFGGTIGGATFELGNKAVETNGGAFYINGGNVEIKGGVISHNKSIKKAGGGFYVNGGTISVNNATVSYNEAATDGGAFYATGGGAITIENNSAVTYNKALNYGGAAYSSAGITVDHSMLSYNEAKKGGGAYCSAGQTKIINGCMVERNEAEYGAGAYVGGGTLTIDGAGSKVQYNTADYDGGGFYVKGGNTTIDGGSVEHNQATSGCGGGFYMQGGTATIEGGTVQNNTASNGGGLYMLGTDGSHKAIANFSNGSFSGNSATTAGGGIYLADYSELNMSGSSAITGNSAGVKGGGVFKTAGNGHSKLQVSGTSLQVVNNTAGGQRNNVYLDSYSDYITVDPDAGISDQVKVGISVNVNSAADLPTPVIHCDDVSKLNDIFNMLKTSTGTSGVFDDASKYLAVYQSHPLPFNVKEIFFIATWIAEVTQPEHFDINNPEISTPDELAWFMVLVNGLNGQSAHPGLNGTVINDIDMSAYFWSPIGEWNHGDEQAPQSIYTGTFDGQGHTISGLSTCGIINYFNYGLFGHTGSTADIKNVVLADCDFTSGEAKRMGNLIAEMDGGTVSNCIVSGKLNPSGSETQGNDEHYCVVGGLIGETKNNAIIRNCIATEQIQAEPIDDAEFYPGMQAFTVGGLVGMASAGTVIENSFANPEIHHGGKQGTGTTLSNPNRYVGGLIGENHGTVRNCYVRLQRDNQLTATVSKFGMFAGENSGTIDCCYYPAESLRNIKVGSASTPTQPLVNAGSNPTNYGEYNTTVTPYYYKHNDNLVTEINGAAVETPVSLLAKLNEWVGDNATYSHWMRTYASPVNADYPVLEYDNLASTMGYTTIASRDGINMEYNKSLNTMIGKYNTNGSALFVYNTPAEEINKSTAIPLYVGEDVALQLKSGTAITSAYVGITLDNSRQKTVGSTTAKQFNWHMFATPLAAAPLGVNYEGNTTTYNYWNGQTLPQFNFYTESDYDGYFPSKTFGTNADYYDDWDYYCYSEPDYHWINFKRNSASHFHQDTENPDLDPHAQITYENEPTLVKGKGYLLATKEATYLQSHGKLNNDDVTITLSKTEEVQECFRGCNLIGNPYQAYLDFNQTGLGSYAILDEDAGGYVAYASRASKNTYPATSSAKGSGVPAPSQYIHMHQGFFVVAASDGQEVTFSPGMCVTNVNSTFRGEEQPAYPLVNLAVTEADGSREFVTIELDRPDNGGAVKMKGLRNGSSLIYTHVDGEDYSIAFMPVGTTTAAVRFETLDEGTFTMNWNTQNGAFSYLHLIDNKTGMDIDCLASGEYRFKASPEDYASRFKLVFSYTGVEEAEAEAEDFAFLMNGILVINGEGTADIFDLTGRLVSSTRLTGSQNTLSLPALTQGLYMIRLSNGNGSKVQKIVIK